MPMFMPLIKAHEKQVTVDDQSKTILTIKGKIKN